MNIKVKMDRDLPQGLGIVLDQFGNEISRIEVPGGKRPDGAHTLVLSIEDYAVFLRHVGEVQSFQQLVGFPL